MRLGISVRYSLAKGSGLSNRQLLPLVEKSTIDDIELDPSIGEKEMEWIVRFLENFGYAFGLCMALLDMSLSPL